jgi:hypothetical protein
MDSLALTLTIINAGQAVLDEAQAQIDALPAAKTITINLVSDAPEVAAESTAAIDESAASIAETSAAESGSIEETIAALMAGNEEFETQFLLTMSAAQLAIGKTDLALDSLGASETEAGAGLAPLAVGEDEVAAGGDAIMGSMKSMLATLALRHRARRQSNPRHHGAADPSYGSIE